MKKSKTVVIGSGVIGLACAIRLLEKNIHVLLIDIKPPGSEASNNNACVLSESSIIPISSPSLYKQIPGYLLKKDSPLMIRYASLIETAPWLLSFLRSGHPKKYQHIAKSLSTLQQNVLQEHKDLASGTESQKLIVESPMLFLFEDRLSFNADQLSWKTRRKNKVVYHEVNADKILQLEPHLSEGAYQYGVLCEKHGFIADSTKYLNGLFEKFRQNGGEFEQEKIIGITPQSDKILLKTEQADITAAQVVIAAGSHSGKLAKFVGEKIPITSEGGYWVDVYDSGIKVNRQMINTRLKIAITPLEDRIRFAGLVEFGGVDAKPDMKLCERLKNNAKEMFPNINLIQTKQGYGQRPSTPDSLPVISSSSKNPRIFYACGHQHVGLSTAPITAKIISAMLNKELPTVNIAPFSIQRFHG